MKFRFFFLLISYAVFSGFFLVSAIAADASGDRFAWLDISRISDRSDLEAVTLGKEWQFVPGKPGSSWMTAFQKGIPFSLNGSLVNLDTLSSQKFPRGSEAVLYNHFHSERDGIAQLGIGCDWWFEVYSNGVFCASTMKSGNGKFIIIYI